MKRFWIVISLVFVGGQLHAQLPELEKSNKAITDEIQEVLNLSGGNVKDDQLAFNLSLARDYYKLDDYAKSEYHYLKVIDHNICTPLDYKALGISLRHNGKAILGEDFYKAYNEVRGKSSNDQLFYKAIDTELGKYERVRESAVTNYGWIYGSVNSDGSTNLNIDNGTVTANLGCKSFINTTGIELPDVEFGRVGSFCPGPEPGSFIYSYKEADNYHIYFIKQKKGQFIKASQLELGPINADYAYPYYSGSNLFFASNKEGGQGGYDLYTSHWNGKSFEPAKTMGTIINSDKNEILPNTIDGQFMFSSNGHPGQGGYDMFYADWNFERLTPVPFPFNSADDEFQLLDLASENASVIKEKNGRTNVYYIEIYKDYHRPVYGYVIDEEGEAIPNAYIILNDRTGRNFDVSNDDGDFSLSVNDTISDYHLTTFCDGYITNQLPLNLNTLGDNKLVIQLLTPAPPKPEIIDVYTIDAANVIPTEPNDSLPVDTSQVKRLFEYNYLVFHETPDYTEVYNAWNEIIELHSDAEIIRNLSTKVYYVVKRVEGDEEQLLEIQESYKNDFPEVKLMKASFY